MIIYDAAFPAEVENVFSVSMRFVKSLIISLSFVCWCKICWLIRLHFNFWISTEVYFILQQLLFNLETFKMKIDEKIIQQRICLEVPLSWLDLHWQSPNSEASNGKINYMLKNLQN